MMKITNLFLLTTMKNMSIQKQNEIVSSLKINMTKNEI